MHPRRAADASQGRRSGALAMSYERPVSGLIWVWRVGKNCHPNPID
jgi:hypothetical protein